VINTTHTKEPTEQSVNQTATPSLAELDLRDYFAARAMAALIASAFYDSRQVFDAAKEAYFLADAMLEVRSKS
jgi:hypothetical protein